MRRTLLYAFLLLSVLAPIAARPQPATAEAQTVDLPQSVFEPGTPPGEFMGMVVRDPHYEWNTNTEYQGTNRAFYDTMGAKLKEAGVKWVRIEFFANEFGDDSSAIQTKRRGYVDVEKYAYFVNVVAPTNGFKVIGLLATPLVRQRPVGDPTRYPSTSYAPGAYLNPELIEASLSNNVDPYGYINPYMRIWLENAFQVALSFPYNASTGAGVAAFEVLNEENRYLLGGGKGIAPTRVADLLTKYYRVYKNDFCARGVITGNCADVRILLGGIHPDRCDDCLIGSPPHKMTDREYLDAIYKSAAFGSYRSTNGAYPLDGVGYHPYPAEIKAQLLPEDTGFPDLYKIPQRIREMRQVMVNNGDTTNNIWVTEIGERGTTRDPDNMARQAAFMSSAYWMLWQQRAYIQTVLWFKYEDFGVDQSTGKYNELENWGVVRIQPRPINQFCLQDLPPERQTCEYEMRGTIQTIKPSYNVFKNMAQSGAGLETYREYLSVIGK